MARSKCIALTNPLPTPTKFLQSPCLPFLAIHSTEGAVGTNNSAVSPYYVPTRVVGLNAAYTAVTVSVTHMGIAALVWPACLPARPPACLPARPPASLPPAPPPHASAHLPNHLPELTLLSCLPAPPLRLQVGFDHVCAYAP